MTKTVDEVQKSQRVGLVGADMSKTSLKITSELQAEMQRVGSDVFSTLQGTVSGDSRVLRLGGCDRLIDSRPFRAGVFLLPGIRKKLPMADSEGFYKS